MPNESPSGCLLAILRLFGVELGGGSDAVRYPYQARKYLLTKAERSFFGVLQQAVQGRYLIFAKVRLADLLLVRARTDGRQSFQNRINAKHLDFVLCDVNTVSPVVCIELDDASHQRSDRVDRDHFVDNAMRTAGLPLVRIKARTSYRLDEVRDAIEQALPDATP